MAQRNWLYLGETGRRYNVGMFHGDRTGHVLILCNSRIVLIDFSVQQSKQYSFFIDDELFEFSINRQHDRYAYECNINEEADTPRNRIRKEQKKNDYRKTVALLTCFALVILGVLGFAMAASAPPSPFDLQAALDQRGHTAIARVFVDPPTSQTGALKVEYAYIADGHTHEFQRSLSLTNVNGFPLRSGDEFMISYLPERPELHEIQWQELPAEQIERYQALALEEHRLQQEQLTAQQAACQVQLAYDLRGINGLALLYNQSTPESSDSEYNELTFLRFIRDIPFQEAVNRRCGL